MLDISSFKRDSPPASPTRRLQQDPFGDPSHRRESAPPPFTENQPLIIYDDKTTLDGPASVSVSDNSTLPTSTDGQSFIPPTPIMVDNEAVAMERAAQSLEEAAAQQTNEKIQKMLLRKAKKMRRKAAKQRGEHKATVGKGIAGGLVMLVTTPLYIGGSIIEGTGTMLKATGMLLKGAGSGLKKPHTCLMDKFDL